MTKDILIAGILVLFLLSVAFIYVINSTGSITGNLVYSDYKQQKSISPKYSDYKQQKSISPKVSPKVSFFKCIKCIDSDRSNYLTKGNVLVYNTLTGATVKDINDYCYTYPTKKTYLMEGICKNNTYNYIQKNCAGLGKGYACENGACLPPCPKGSYKIDGYCSPKGTAKYFIDNYGKLDCTKPENTEFCNYFNSAKKYYGFGEHILSSGDIVIIPPFMFKWEVKPSFVNFDILWTDKNGSLRFLASLGSYYPSDDNLQKIYSFQGVYAYSENMATPSVDKPTQFIFSESCQELLSFCTAQKIVGCEGWCFYEAAPNETTSKTPNFTVFANNSFKEGYDLLMAQSLENCLTPDINYLGIKPVALTIFVRVLKTDNGGGCSAGGVNEYVCKNTLDFVNNYVYGLWNIPALIDEGKCSNFNGQAHELIHLLVYGTPLYQSGVLNEGLANYVGNQHIADDGAAQGLKYKCLENGYVVEYADGVLGEIQKYENLSKFEFNSKMYDTAACIWGYIEDTYGHDKFVKIMQAMDGLRFKPGTYYLFHDIINPILGTDILPVMQKRFQLEEMTVTFII
ncbi:MAG: hypothetical protein COT15_03325 [Candidatus Diapherotrites archaeon CG08_land_8_20_14_0_20_34_12]|nr:MAG: hypothetical protein COT15_03325 [Candidatus Diapherotrites archaeon CG08_land_8_20_14_0_20_34_12]